MASNRTGSQTPVCFIGGEDEYSVKRRAKQIFQEWTAEAEDLDREVIDAQAMNAGEAMQALARLREALQTLPFFGGGKIVWFRNCNFLGDDRTAASQTVTGSLADLANELKNFNWSGVRLLISSGKVDKRKTFYKTLAKLGQVELFDGWNPSDRNWENQAEDWTRNEVKARGKNITQEALSLLVAAVGPNPRLLSNEIEKLSLFVGDEPLVEIQHVEEIAIKNKQARAFALGDALGDRHLPRLLRTLDDELWGLRLDRQKSEIGLLYGLISKVRALLLLKELLDRKMIRTESNYPRFQAQWKQLPADAFPEDKRFNPAAMNAYVFFKALPQARNYSREELIRAMELLLQCNRALVFSGLEPALVMQQTLVQIVNGT